MVYRSVQTCSATDSPTYLVNATKAIRENIKQHKRKTIYDNLHLLILS